MFGHLDIRKFAEGIYFQKVLIVSISRENKSEYLRAFPGYLRDIVTKKRKLKEWQSRKEITTRFWA